LKGGGGGGGGGRGGGGGGGGGVLSLVAAAITGGKKLKLLNTNVKSLEAVAFQLEEARCKSDLREDWIEVDNGRAPSRKAV